jgi:alpha-beta hydrolase superfamily lysophospholipase
LIVVGAAVTLNTVHEAYLAELPEDLRPDPLPHRRSTWWRWRDTEVHVERIGDPAAPRRALMLHGAGGNTAAMWPYAALTATRGYHVVVPDLPGYGRTLVPRPGAVRYPDWVGLACDLAVAERAAHGGPLLLIGASMGGMLAYEAATRTGVADRVVVTCLFDPRDPAARRHIGRLPWLGAAARPLLRLLAGPLADLRVPIRWIANMRAIANTDSLVELVLRDEHGGGNHVPLGFVRSFLESAPAVEPERADVPEIVLAHPAADRWTPVEISLSFFERISAPKRLVLLEGAGHYPVEAPGAHQLAETIADIARR